MPSLERRRRIVIVGAGQTGRALVRMLSAAWEVAVLDLDPVKLERLRVEVGDRPLKLIQKDGTSLINLREAGIEGAAWVAALTNRDEVNVEVCRLALALDEPPAAIGIVRQPEAVKKMQAVGAEALTRPAAIAGLLANRIQSAQQVAVNVGLGRGEILEIPVLAGSPAADARVADLHAGRWVVAAIYRAEQLLIPHGDAVIRQGDRLLLTGDPEILPHIGDYLRTGVARFPLQFGSRVVALAEGRLSDRYRSEIEYVCGATRAKAVRFLSPRSAPHPVLSIESVRVESETFDDDTEPRARLLRLMPDLDCGTLIIEKKPALLFERMGLTSPPYREMLDRLPCPLLLAGGSHPYRRIVLPVTDSRGSMLSADLAIDLSRQLDVPIVAVAVRTSALLGDDSQDDQRKTLARVSDMASLYHMRIEQLEREGNPVREVARIAGAGDLLVTAHRGDRRPSFFNPDASLLIVDRAPCSVLVLPYK